MKIGMHLLELQTQTQDHNLAKYYYISTQYLPRLLQADTLAHNLF